ncbi:PTS sugar transporter subunit IIA [Parerythrobacter lacustris]|uniref:PTS sugar transporter subunit IIA n=1 Tax=Parerythrobacter lacustris TaxID=2969984 RepID=A0ABT1XS58_9SPHN|nr:PTS sugar transporter subunit IIA [Parerythrobacter lacustris]MCR2834475.1 PTS sugar transporter subunit IIA [Parerythrobacter lacustris]
MHVHFKLLPEAVFTAGVAGKQAVLEAIADRFAAVYKVDREVVLESLLEREALGSTGFGRGVAIPHARIAGISRPVAVLLRLEEPIDFAAADGMPVELVFGLLSPENAGASHLQALAAISRIVRDEAMHRALVESVDGEALFALLTNHLDRDAA